MPLLSLICAPVTWLLRPTATLNLVMRIAFASSAMAMFVTLRRFVVSQPAAFVGR